MENEKTTKIEGMTVLTMFRLAQILELEWRNLKWSFCHAKDDVRLYFGGTVAFTLDFIENVNGILNSNGWLIDEIRESEHDNLVIDGIRYEPKFYFTIKRTNPIQREKVDTEATIQVMNYVKDRIGMIDGKSFAVRRGVGTGIAIVIEDRDITLEELKRIDEIFRDKGYYRYDVIYSFVGNPGVKIVYGEW